MALTTLDFGTQVDLLNDGELREALAEDRRLRAEIRGIRNPEFFVPTGTIGAGNTTYTTPVSMVSGGEMWAVMNIGCEQASSAAFRVYKGVPPGVASGFGRFFGQAPNASTTPQLTYSKGQFPLRAGDQLTIISASTALLSVLIVAIAVPAERYGELLI